MMGIKLRGPVEHSPYRPNPEAVADPDYENIWKIFVYFECQIHNEVLLGENCCFLAFFKTRSKVSTCQVLSFPDQPFRFLPKNVMIYPFFP